MADVLPEINKSEQVMSSRLWSGAPEAKGRRRSAFCETMVRPLRRHDVLITNSEIRGSQVIGLIDRAPNDPVRGDSPEIPC